MALRHRAGHGTPSGYYRHRNERDGEWDWPACAGCKKAHRDDKKTRQTPEVMEAARVRQSAHRRATSKLRGRHAAEFARLYSQELSVLRDDGKTAQAGLERQIEQALMPLSCSEEVLRQRCAAGLASPGERAVMKKVLHLNWQLIDLEFRLAKEKPGQPR